jgi:multiple sugar transport system permease protein
MRRFLHYLALAIACLIALTPILWMIATSFKTNREATQDGTILPASPTLASYTGLFTRREFGHYFANALIVTSFAVGIALVIGSLAAYALARFRLRFDAGKRLAFVLLIARMLPTVILIVPIYILTQRLGLLDTRLALVMIYAAFDVSLVVWMMDSFFREIPVDLEEAAMVDGDSRLTAFRRIVLPLAAPGLVATAIFAVIVTYNEFLFALLLTSTPDAQTMPVGVATLMGRINIDWGAMAAAGVLGAVPIIIFAMLVQRHLVRGLTLGAVK